MPLLVLTYQGTSSNTLIKQSGNLSHTEYIVSRELCHTGVLKIMLNIIIPQFTCFADKLEFYGQIASKWLKHSL